MIKVLDFWAEWCYPCKIMEPVIAKVENELKGKVIFEKINVDKDPQVSQKYNIFSIPTYVVEINGQEVDRMVGATQKENFLEFIGKHLTS